MQQKEKEGSMSKEQKKGVDARKKNGIRNWERVSISRERSCL